MGVIGLVLVGFFFVTDKKIETKIEEAPAVQATATTSVEYNCAENGTYLAVLAQSDPFSPAQLIVYKKSTLPELIECSTYSADPVLAVAVEATFIINIFGDYLLTDTGTGPSLRTLGAYSLVSGVKVLEEEYFQPDELIFNEPTSLTFWGPDDTTPTAENCNGFNEIVAQSLTPQVIVQVTTDLVTGVEAVGEVRCIATQ